MSKTKNWISYDTQIEGKVVAHDVVYIEGEIIGNVEGHSEVVVQPNGKIKGPIRAKTVTIFGKIQGEIFSNGKVEVQPGGHIQGTITTPQGGLIVHEGGLADCKLTVLEQSPQQILQLHQKIKD